MAHILKDWPHPGGCPGCRLNRVCNVCGKTLGDRCTNGRCRACHRAYCTPGGNTGAGHGYGTVPAQPQSASEKA